MGRSHNVHEYVNISMNMSKCSRIMSKCSWICQHVHEYVNMFMNMLTCSWICQHVQNVHKYVNIMEFGIGK